MNDPSEMNSERRRWFATEGTAPSFGLLMVEPQRAVLEAMTLLPTSRWLDSAPEGDGHPVVVLPGFVASDASTRVLRDFLKRKGWNAHPWLQGRNLGLKAGLREAITERVLRLHDRYGERVSLVGWSLGGVFAREIAKTRPEVVRQVITLGSPFGNVARRTHATRLYLAVAGDPEEHEDVTPYAIAEPPDLPCTAIYSKTDGVVPWESCIERETDLTENIEVPGSHCGLGMNPLVFYAVADRLSQPAGRWRKFERNGWRARVYG